MDPDTNLFYSMSKRMAALNQDDGETGTEYLRRASVSQ